MGAGTGTGARIARSLVAVSAVAALGCTAACGGGGSGQDGKASRPTAGERTGTSSDGSPQPRDTRGAKDTQDTQDGQSTQDAQDAQDGQGTRGPRDPETPRGTPDAGKAAAGPLSEARLKKAALVTGDVKGYEIDTSGAADLLGGSAPAAPARCQPIADMFLFATDPAPENAVSRGVGAKDELDASVTTLALLSYGPGGAEKVMDGLRAATEDCTAYRHTGYEYKNVKGLPDPDRGDESVAYRLLASIEGARVPVAYTVVRRGTTLVAFSSMNMLKADRVEVPDELVAAQLKKLARTTG